MKVKRLREDFIVREVSDFRANGGLYAVYQLKKRGMGTPEVASQILRIWSLPREAFGYGGLKDRHATTSQTVTIYRGPRSDLQQPGFTLSYVGQASREFSAQDIAANEFEITLRGLTADRARQLSSVCETLSSGVPNYFDDQRFGSVGFSGQFIAHPWCLGDYERALFLAIAEANPHDRPHEREQKEIVRDHWGQWKACKDRLDRSNRRSVVTYLVDHPAGFKKAVALLPKDMRSIYVAAFQSKIWNEVVCRMLRQLIPHQDLVSLDSAAGQLVLPLRLQPSLAEQLTSQQIPLPSGRKTRWQPEILCLLRQVLGELDMQLHQLRFSYPRDVFFSRRLRPVMLIPQDLTVHSSADELGRDDQRKLLLKFRLAAGQYATLLLKGLDRLAANR